MSSGTGPRTRDAGNPRTRDAMSSQERVRTAIARKVPDRVPIMDGPWGATGDGSRLTNQHDRSYSL